MKEIQNILNVTFPFVENLLKEFGEFYPLASAVNLNNEVEQVVLEENEENDFPKSTTVIGELKKELRWRKKDFKAVAIFYDVRVKEKNTDAIAVFVESKIEKAAFTFYYPYSIHDNKCIFSDSWKELNEIEIFVKY